MSNERISDIQVLINMFSWGADRLNYIVISSTAAFDAEDEEVTYIDQAVQVAFEGYVLQPRHLLCQPFEIVINAEDETAQDKVQFMFDLIKESSVQQAGRDGMAFQLIGTSDLKLRPFASMVRSAS